MPSSIRNLTATPSRSKARFEVLDSWRGVCALLVAAMHLSTQFHYSPLSEASVTSQFYLFVDFFFVLSGFVIAHAYQNSLTNGESFVRFAIRRIGRLWPLHAAMFAIMLFLEEAKAITSMDTRSPAFGPGWEALYSAANLFLLHAFGFVPQPNVNGPSWTISAELWTNLLFGLIVLGAGRRALLVLCALGLGSAAALVVYTHREFLEVTTDYGLLRCIYGFVVGVVIYRLWTRWPNAARIGWAEGPAVLLVCAFLIFAAWPPLTMFAPAVFGFAIFVFAYEAGGISTAMRSRPMLRLGLWSYSIYLVHWPLFVLLSRFIGFVDASADTNIRADHELDGTSMLLVTFDSPVVQLLTSCAVLLLLVGLSALSYRYIEAPGRSFFNALAKSPRLSKPPLARGP